MIKRAKKRFILLALTVVAAVIIVIVAGIDVATYLDMKDDADRVLSFLEGAEPGLPPEGAPGDLPGKGQQPRQGRFEKPKDLPVETAFSSRYFTVVCANGAIVDVNLDNVAFVTPEEIAGYVAKATGTRGFVGNYRYKVSEEGGMSVYTFLDCEKEIDSCRTFVVNSAIVTAIGLAVIALLIILLSGKVLAPVEESYRKQKQFITDAGHELKTPLTVIGANAELLEMDLGEDNEWLRSIKGQVAKLGKLTKELVFLSRMDEADAVIARAPFSLESALEDCIAGFKEAAAVAGKEILPALTEVQVTANEEMIRRAVGLILDNAIKYAESDRIGVALRKEGKWAVIEETNASSLPKGAHPELFERFYRPDSSRNAATGGHGIGLSVVKSVLEAHGGAATCESDGRIVTFRLTLPL